MGNDMNASGADGIFSPNCNLHRSTYGGRNCGYQSEDPILSGRYVSEIIKGISIYGRMTFVKHFVANDQDFNRMANMAWMTEQTFRELYLRSFEEAVKNGGTVGIMTSFNRVGGLWAGGNEALIQGVLRKEWGFRGQIITDMTENKTNMDIGLELCERSIELLGEPDSVNIMSTDSDDLVESTLAEFREAIDNGTIWSVTMSWPQIWLFVDYTQVSWFIVRAPRV